MTSTTTVTTFIHIILLLHVFSNICRFKCTTSHMSLLYTTVVSVCFLYYKENASYHSSSGSSDPTGRSTSSVSSSLSSSSDHVDSSPHVDVIKDVDVLPSYSPSYTVVASLSLTQFGEATSCRDSGPW